MAISKINEFQLHHYNRSLNEKRPVREWIDEVNGVHTTNSNSKIIEAALGEIRNAVNDGIDKLAWLEEEAVVTRADLGDHSGKISELNSEVSEARDTASKNSENIGNIFDLETKNTTNLVEAVNQLNEGLSTIIYKCTGENDNILICQLVEDFFNTNDGVKRLRINLKGVLGVDKTAFGDGTKDNPYKAFFENSGNPYGKTLIINGEQCVFPNLEYSVDRGYLYAYYFNMKNVQFENVVIEIKSTITEPNTNSTVCGFYECNNISNCRSTGRGVGYDGGIFDFSTGHGYGFHTCSEVCNCVGIGESSGNDIAFLPNSQRGVGFYNCTNLSKCLGSGKGRENTDGASFGSCVGLTNCLSTVGNFYKCARLLNCSTEGVSFGYCTDLLGCIVTYGLFVGCTNLSGCSNIVPENTSATTVFYECTNLSNCTGMSVLQNGDTQAFFECNNLSNCIGTSTGVGGAGYKRAFYECKNLSNCSGTGVGGEYAVGFHNCTNLSNCIGSGNEGKNAHGFNTCATLSGCIGDGTIGDSNAKTAYGFAECSRLENCKGYGYRLSTVFCKIAAFYWGSAVTGVAQMMNCTAPIKAKSGYVQDHGVFLDGADNGAMYFLIGNTIAADVQDGFVGIKKHTKTGDNYTEIGTIRANIE